MAGSEAGSLATVVDGINEAIFLDHKITTAKAAEAAKFITARQGLPGSYRQMFAPLPEDMQGFRLFTGERVKSRVGCRHILGQEACRVMAMLKPKDAAARQALGRARQWLEEMTPPPTGDVRKIGTSATAKQSQDAHAIFSIGTYGAYCCGTCSVAMWRNITAGGFADGDARIAAGLAVLKAYRQADGRWGRFPFFYTLSALIEMADIDPPAARAELRHAGARCEKLLARRPGEGTYSDRRRMLLQRVLGEC